MLRIRGKNILFSVKKEEDLPFLTFLGNQDFTLKTYNTTKNWDGILEYSTDTSSWSTWDGTEISSVGSKLYLRGIGNTKVTGNSSNYRFVFTGTDALKISCEGNIESLLDFYVVNSGEHPVMANYCYYCLFYGCTCLTTAPELPATTLTSNCYSHMFSECKSLITAPELPATTLVSSCYDYMFNRCTTLITAPALPATTLANYCYQYMFRGCTSLTIAPALPATTLAEGCYGFMFYDCTSLITVPELPATTLVDSCYNSMFRGCTSLTTAPRLPATTLKPYCYEDMFYMCALTTIPELAATTLAARCYHGMFSYCRSIKLSTTQTGDYTTPYRIPASGTGTTAANALMDMFSITGGTFTGTPSINTTYYTSNTIV